MRTRYSRQSPHLKILFITYLPVELFQPVAHWVYCKDDIASEHFHSSHLGLLLLTKAIIVFMAGEHPGAISRLDDLIATTRSNSLRTCIFLETRRWNVMTTRVQCIRSRARAQMQGDVGPPLFAISLMSGLQFDLLDILIRQRLCDIGLHNGATLDEKTLPNNVSRASKTLVSQLRTHPSMTPIPLLREWAKATLFVVPSFTTYVALCERLETIDRITDAVECFYDMTNELGGDIYMSEPMTEWVCGEFMFTCLTAVTRAATLLAFTQ
ncbi:hypothetical protein L210DRAFT_3524406 [Boletus edulis BED1]|uniref:Uncharacterized protein n=1 Tax=Boletus edulis BED1 TaxID=1328754 RepID=A0AAD4GKJ8_BOLED|nr:hypothetical protein L210DRAFT_3524406 [Boletus edulis BED1]